MKIDSDAILFFERIVEPAIREFDAADDALDDAADLDDARSLAMRRARTAAIELHQFCDRVFDSAPEWRSRGGLEGIRDWLTAGVGYLYNRKDSNYAEDEYRNNRFMVSLRAVY